MSRDFALGLAFGLLVAAVGLLFFRASAFRPALPESLPSPASAPAAEAPKAAKAARSAPPSAAKRAAADRKDVMDKLQEAQTTLQNQKK